jgi:hypothetical protein
MKTTLQPPKTIELIKNFTKQRRTANIFGVFEFRNKNKKKQTNKAKSFWVFL